MIKQEGEERRVKTLAVCWAVGKQRSRLPANGDITKHCKITKRFSFFFVSNIVFSTYCVSSLKGSAFFLHRVSINPKKPMSASHEITAVINQDSSATASWQMYALRNATSFQNVNACSCCEGRWCKFAGGWEWLRLDSCGARANRLGSVHAVPSSPSITRVWNAVNVVFLGIYVH